MTKMHVGILLMVGVVVVSAISYQQADAQVISYRIHPDIFTELQDRYPEHATEYWDDIRDAIRDGINDWTELNHGLIFTPSHNDAVDVTIEWIDSSRAWGVEYHDRSGGNRIGIDFDTPEPDQYGASLMNPDIVRFVMAHELGHVLGMGHSQEEGHLMYGLANPRPDNTFNDMGYIVPYVRIGDFENVGGNKLGVPFHMQGYPVYDIEIMEINGMPYIVMSTGDDGIYVANMSNPHNPSLAGSYDINSKDTESLDGWPYLVVIQAHSITVLNMTDLPNIRLAGTIDIRGHNGNNNYSGNNATLVDLDGTISLVTIMGHGLVRQYDLTDLSDIESAGVYYDEFLLPSRGVQLADRNDIQYALVDVGYDGTLVFRLSAENSLARMKQHMGLTYNDVLHTTVSVGEDEYRIAYWNGQILVHEVTSKYSSDPIGRLLGYVALEIDSMNVNGAIYAVVAAGTDGVFGIHIGDEDTGKWTFN